MSAPAVSNAEMVEIQFRKWMGKRLVQNITLHPTYSHPSVPAGKRVIAEVIDCSGQGLFFTDTGFTLPGRGFIHYDHVKAAAWISAKPDQARFSRKREDYDHIELSLQDGSSVTLADVEQAVFPLLHFFRWMVARRDHAD